MEGNLKNVSRILFSNDILAPYDNETVLNFHQKHPSGKSSPLLPLPLANILGDSTETNQRGADLALALDNIELHILNRGSEPTFEVYRGGKRYSCCVDVMTCSTETERTGGSLHISRDQTTG